MIEYQVMLSKYQLLIGLIFLFSSIRAQKQELTLRECIDKSPIQNAYVIDKHKTEVIGYSNQQGKIVFFSARTEWPPNLKIYKMSALDTSVVVARDDTSICLNSKKFELSAFEVFSEKEDFADSFRQYLDRTIGLLKDSDTTHYYTFSWKYMLPDSNWSMNVEGVIKMPYKSFAKFNSGGYAAKFCQMKIRLDSGFFNSNFLENNNINYIASSYLIQSDHIRKRFPFRKRVRDEYVIDRISEGQSTKFVYTTPVKKDWKLLLSYPMFNSDSILFQNDYELQLIEIDTVQKSNFSFLEEKNKVGYTLIDGELVMSSIEASDKLRHVSGSISLVEFSASLISEPVSVYEEMYIMMNFKKEVLSVLNKSNGYEVIVE